MEIKNSIIGNTVTALNSIDSKELKLMNKFDAFKLYAEEALPNASTEKVAWFVSNAVAELRNNPELMEAAKIVPAQLFGALMKSFQLGIPIGSMYRQASLIPRNDKNTVKSITLQLWTRAYKTLAARSGIYKEVMIRPIYDCDKFEVKFENGNDSFKLEPDLWSDKEKAKKLGYIAYTTNLKTGNVIFKVYPMSFIEKRRVLAKTSTFWDKWPDEMETKTVLGAFCKNELDIEFGVQGLIGEDTENKVYSLNVDEKEPELKEDVIDVDEIPEELNDFDKGLKDKWDKERKKKEEIKEKVEADKQADSSENISDDISSLFNN